MTEEMAMEKVAKGKLEWAAFLFERYHLPLYNYFFKLSFDEPLSEDMTQEVFYRLIRYRKSYQEGASVKPWLFTLARNVWLKHHQKVRKFVELSTIKDEFNTDIISKDNLDLLERALQKLPEEEREVIILVKIEKMSYKDLSSLLGLNEGALRVKTHRILQRLKKIYFELTD